MPRPEMPAIETASLRARIDPASHARGLRYAGQGAVVQFRWDTAQCALQGLVRGSGGAFYTTIAYFSPGSRAALRFSGGDCSCPVGGDCKHVVALVVTATSTAGDPLPAVPAPAPAWQASIDGLLAGPAAAARPGQLPLALELALAPAQAEQYRTAGTPPGTPAVPRLTARLLEPRGAGWTGGSLSWSRLDTLQYYGGYQAAQVRLLRELYALYGSGLVAYYGYRDEKRIDLGAFESRQLWPLLDEAVLAGVRLVRRGRLGELPAVADAEICLDVRAAPDGRLVIGAVTGGLPAAAVPVRFIGSDGHGLVYADRAETRSAGCGSWHFGLARLARPVPAALQKMVLAADQVEIPASAAGSFRDSYYPRLRQAAPVITGDGSFTPPVISGPTLVLRAAYQDGHRADVGWEWEYQVGDSRPRLAADLAGEPGPRAGQDGGYRDRQAEQAILAGLDSAGLDSAGLDSAGLDSAGLDGAGLDSAGLGGAAVNSAAAGLGLIRTGPDGPVPAAASLRGIDTMRLSTELLPLLAGQPGVAVEVTGEPLSYREVSDSVRIGVSAGEIPGDRDWFDLGITISAGGQDVPFTDVFVALSHGQSHLLLANGTYFALDKPELQALARLIEEARALADVPGDGLRISRFQAGLWEELTELGVVGRQAAAWQRQVAGLLAADPAALAEPPAALTARLRPYQREGFGWLAFLWRHGLGGILADDMGLGKTLQSLALICHAKQDRPDAGPFLIVAPTSVVPNWAAEAARFAPGLRVVQVRETDARRGRPLGEIIGAADAVVTSYALLRIDIESYAAARWAGLILDEAQFAKNHRSRIYQCARRIPAAFKLAITGTPMENNLMELWALLSITAPGLFPDPDRFSEYYARPIERSGDAELLGRLRRRIRPLVMRRTKEQVARDLPAKQEQVLEVDLHPRHRRIYQTHLQRERQKVLGLIADLDAHRFMILRSLTLLRQLSLHAALADPEHELVPSAKIDLLAEQLGDVVAGGHRALVFSQFTGFLTRVREELGRRGIAHAYLDGRTRDRPAQVERFRAGEVPVFVISLKAGGFGLNLTEADYCFLLDPWWNPATEAQAVDRAHRIGQTRNVMVYRLIARDTVEEKVMALKARKARLFASVLDEGNAFGARLDADDIRGLFF